MGQRLLFLDSDRNFIKEHKVALEAAFEVDFLYNPDGVVPLLEKVNYAAVLICVEISENKGYAICSAIRKNPKLADLKIALISANATAEEYARHRKLMGKADLYLHKPLVSTALVAALRSLVPPRSANHSNPLGGLSGVDPGDQWLERFKAELRADEMPTPIPTHPAPREVPHQPADSPPEKEAVLNRESSLDELSGDNYPTLKILSQWKPQETQAPPFDPARLAAMLQGRQLRQLDSPHMGHIFMEMLSGGFLELFVEAIEQVRSALESMAPDDRRWALESVRALVTLADLDRIPSGTLPLLLGCIGSALVKEERTELRDVALDMSASLLGIEALRGNLDSIQAYHAWLEQMAGSRSAEYSARVMASRNIASPVLELFFVEGQSVLESRVLPFFRFLGESGARTLTQLLDEEKNRQRRSRIIELLKLLGPLSIPALNKALVAGPWHLVRNALNLVGDLQEPQAFEYVVPCLEHPDLRVVRAAVKALWKTGGAKAERFLLELLPNADAERQIEILRGLGQIQAVGAIPAIGVLASKGPENVRIKALETLGRIGHSSAMPILETQLQRKGRVFKTAEPQAIRLASAQALAALGTPEARQVLDRIAKEEPKGTKAWPR